MGKDDPDSEIRPESEQSVELSQYDARMSCDTTPTNRVEWVTDDGFLGRSAYDASLTADTTPTQRPEPIDTMSDADDSSAASGQQPADQ